MNLAFPTAADVAELQRLVADLNRFVVTIPELPVFADDAAAEAGRVKVGEGYVTPDGVVRRRVA